MKLSWNKKFGLLVVGVISAMSLMGYFFGDSNIGKPDHGLVAAGSQKKPQTATAQKDDFGSMGPEYVGKVINGPTWINSSDGDRFIYIVHTGEGGGMVRVNAEYKCPILTIGDEVIVQQRKDYYPYYTFIRPAK